MDKVTQQTAANAEESASAAEELNAQAEQLKVYVEDLRHVIGGSGDSVGRHLSAESKKVPHSFARHTQLVPLKAGAAHHVSLSVHKGTVVRPDQVIPLEEDFKDF